MHGPSRGQRPGPVGKRGTHNLKLHCLPFELNRPNLKVDANRADVALCVGIVCETEEQARLDGADEGTNPIEHRLERERATTNTPFRHRSRR